MRHATPRHILFLLLFLIISCSFAHADIVTGLVGWWKFDGGTSGAIANNATAGFNDHSGRRNNGTAKNTNGTGMAWSAGKFNGAVNFDGVDDYVQVANSSSLRLTGNLTIAAWVNPTGGDANDLCVVHKFQGCTGGYCGYRLGVWKTGMHLFYANSSGVNESFAKTGLSIENIWSHVVVTKNGITVRFYLNGSGFPSGTAVDPVIRESSVPLNIGYNYWNGQWFDGILDDVRIYNRALTEADVLQLYNNGAATKLQNATLRGAVLR